MHYVYKPPNDQFARPALGHRDLPHIVIGDFNSNSTSWSYDTTDNNREAVEQWGNSCNLTLIHDAKLPKSFNSARWKKGYNPDLIFASGSIAKMCKKSIMDLSRTPNTARSVLVPTRSWYHKLYLSDDVLTLRKHTGLDTQRNSIRLLKTLNLFQPTTSVL